jgi:hypothetical protein
MSVRETFYSKLPLSEKKASVERGRTRCIAVMHVMLDSAWNVSETTKASSISNGIKYHSFIILKVCYAKGNFKIQGYQSLILCTSMNVTSKLEERTIISSRFIAVKIKCYILKL